VSLLAGTRLGPYEVLSAIGAGGMGEVYRARDTRLDRQVAIKVIRMDADRPAGFRERFSREAKAISALDHPHICALYDVGQDSGLDYLVIQYLEGETLAQRLARGAPPLDQALQYATQIAAALAAAHRKNIVHRDLKPANVMLTKAGIKLLDFGLAKMAGDQPAAPPGVMATQTAALTADGVIIGTLQYMSPEQLEGREIDGRSDIFSFGGILYEMLSGGRAFAPESMASEIAAIMNAAPPALGDVPHLKASLAAATERSLDRLIRRCLAKDPDERWQSAGDLADELAWIDAERRGAAQAHEPQGGVRGWPARTIAAAALAGAAISIATLAVFGLLGVRGSPRQSHRIQFLVDAPPQTRFADLQEGVAASPDGRPVIFTAAAEETRGPSLWLRSLDSVKARVLPRTEAAASPSWSPDGRSVAFFAEGKLKKVEIAGGTPFALCDASPSRTAPTGIAWSHHGVILFGSAAGVPRAFGALERMAAALHTSRASTPREARPATDFRSFCLTAIGFSISPRATTRTFKASTPPLSIILDNEPRSFVRRHARFTFPRAKPIPLTYSGCRIAR
jgi:eukaryotic-like serine/threonine-protein kinase